MGGTRCEVGEERLVGLHGALLADPGDGLVGHVVGEVVARRWRGWRLDRGGALVERRVELIGLAADEPVEVVEAASGGPQVEWSDRAGLPHWTSWHFPN